MFSQVATALNKTQNFIIKIMLINRREILADKWNFQMEATVIQPLVFKLIVGICIFREIHECNKL